MKYLDLRVTLSTIEIFFNVPIGCVVSDSALVLSAVPGPHAVLCVGIGRTPDVTAVGVNGRAVIPNNHVGPLLLAPGILCFNGPIILVYIVSDRLLHHHPKNEDHAEASHEF